MKIPGVDNSFIVFGEAKIMDLAKNLAETEANKFKRNEPAEKIPEASKEDEEKEFEDEDAGGLKEDDIKQVMESTSCSRGKAIYHLKKHDGDIVEAITALN